MMVLEYSDKVSFAMPKEKQTPVRRAIGRVLTAGAAIVKTVSKMLYTPLRVCSQLLWENLVKPALLKHLAKDLAVELMPMVNRPKDQNVVTNICGLGGQSQIPFKIKWTALYDSVHGPVDWSVHRLKPHVVAELFFSYFAPLEHWCEHNLSGDFALWSDHTSVYLLLTHEHDHLYFRLRFNSQMPDQKMLDSAFNR